MPFFSGNTYRSKTGTILLLAILIHQGAAFRHFAQNIERIPSDVHTFFSKFEDNGVVTHRHKRAEEFGDRIRNLENLIAADPTNAGIQTELDSICDEQNYLEPTQAECADEDPKFRTMDGSCNNLQNPYWGKAMTPFKRLLPAVYSDGLSVFRASVTGQDLPSTRDISLSVGGSESVFDPYRGSDLIMHFGQFVDHDLDQAPLEAETCVPCEVTDVCAPVPVPDDDPVIPSPCFLFRRSRPTINRDCQRGPRNQINQVTSYMDGGLIYGNNAMRANLLRAPEGGLMQTINIMGTTLTALPNDDNNGMCAIAVQEQKCGLSGDGRTAEQPGLTAMHTTFVREHNRIATELAQFNPTWDNERLYQEARKIIGAMWQHMIYNEYLPLMLGAEIMTDYNLKISKTYEYKYDPTVDPAVTHQFATASFRNGHSQINEAMLRLDQDFNHLADPVPLKLGYFNATYAYDLASGGLESILLGMLVTPVQKVDNNFAEAVKDQLFADPLRSFGLDLLAINLQRGRDHGLGTYNDYREICGMDRIQTFGELRSIMPGNVVDGIAGIYAHPDDIDIFVGSFSETPIPGVLQGPTSSCLVAREFRRLKFGDRFWYENREGNQAFSEEQIIEIQKATMARIICNDIQSTKFIQPYVFRLPDATSGVCGYNSFAEFSRVEDFPVADGSLPGFSNKLVRCDNYKAIPKVDLWPWKDFGRKQEL